MKIIVLDFDETLGHFKQLSIIWQSLQFYTEHILENNNLLNQRFFNELLDLLPYYLRPDILDILSYIKDKKRQKKCNYVMIYTNNTGARIWVNYLISYFESKLKYKLFDRVIAAFKIKGNIIEVGRTTNEKTISDLIKCTKLPKNTQICYIDDMLYPEMINDNVYYINIKPYYYDYSFDYILDKIYNYNETYKQPHFKNNMKKILDKFNYKVCLKQTIDYEIDIIISKEILNQLNIFFKENINKTRKRNVNNNNKTKRLSN